MSSRHRTYRILVVISSRPIHDIGVFLIASSARPVPRSHASNMESGTSDRGKVINLHNQLGSPMFSTTLIFFLLSAHYFGISRIESTKTAYLETLPYSTECTLAPAGSGMLCTRTHKHKVSQRNRRGLKINEARRLLQRTAAGAVESNALRSWLKEKSGRPLRVR